MTLQFIPVTEVTFLYNSIKNSLKSEQYEKRYKRLKLDLRKIRSKTSHI